MAYKTGECMKTCSNCGIEFERYKSSTCSTYCTDELKKKVRLDNWINSKKQEPLSAYNEKRKREYNNSLYNMPSYGIYKQGVRYT